VKTSLPDVVYVVAAMTIVMGEVMSNVVLVPMVFVFQRDENLEMEVMRCVEGLVVIKVIAKVSMKGLGMNVWNVIVILGFVFPPLHQVKMM